MESKGEIIVYESGEGQSRLDVKLENETLWLSINQIAQLLSGISL